MLISITWSPLTSCFVPVSSTKPSCCGPISKTTFAGNPDATVSHIHRQRQSLIATSCQKLLLYNLSKLTNTYKRVVSFLTCDPLERNELLDWYRMFRSSSDSWSDRVVRHEHLVSCRCTSCVYDCARAKQRYERQFKSSNRSIAVRSLYTKAQMNCQNGENQS